MIRAVALAAVAGLGVAAATAAAAPGGGLAPIGNSAGMPVAAVDADGRLVVAWSAAECDLPKRQFPCVDPLLLVARYTSEGRLDESFGDEGVQRLPSAATGIPHVFGLAQGPADSMLVAAHYAKPNGSDGGNVVVRISPDGKADGTFGDRGWVQVETGSAFASAPDGGFVIAGWGYTDRSIVTAARYSEAAELVPGFGDDGVARFVYDPDGYSQFVRDVEVTPDGRILVAGTTSGQEATQVAVAQLTSDGDFDPSFGGGDGVLTTAPRTGFAGGGDVMSLSDTGQITLGGTQNSGGSHGGCPNFALIAVERDGEPNPDYGTGGVSTASPQCSSLTAMTSFPDGGVVAVGWTYEYSEADLPFSVARYAADGELDPAFGARGVVLDRFSEGLSGATSTVALAGGSPVAGGTVDATDCALGPASADPGRECTAMALKAYSADGSVDRSFGDDGLVTIPPIRPCRTLNQVTCEPGLSRKQLRRTVRSGVGPALSTWGSQMRLRLRCPYRLQSRCAFQLELRTGRRAPVMATLARRVTPGTTETARVQVKPSERVKLVRSGSAVLTGKVGVQQKTVPIAIRRPVKRQPAP